MCFNIDNNFPNKLKATKDIVCYKVVQELPDKKFRSMYIDYIYKMGKSNLKIKLEKNCYDEIHDGYHSYITFSEAIKILFSDFIVVKCIIPKGSTYYIDKKFNEYVSSNIIIVGKYIQRGYQFIPRNSKFEYNGKLYYKSSDNDIIKCNNNNKIECHQILKNENLGSYRTIKVLTKVKLLSKQSFNK